MSVATANRIDVGPNSVEIRETGSGPALLFIHGFEGPIEAPFVDFFGATHRVVLPTHPGFAGTESHRSLQDIYNVAILYEGILDALGIETAAVAGHSLGAMFAAELAAVAPQRVRSLVLISPIGIWSDDHPAPDVLSAGGSYLTRMLWADPAHPAAAGTTSPAERTANLAAAGHHMWPLPDRGLRDRAFRLTMPVHIVRGDADGLVGAAQVADWKGMIPGATLHSIADAGHFPMLEKPEEFATLISGLLG
jgi:pimeloyl-ACP methyl ester carboxylesterase